MNSKTKSITKVLRNYGTLKQDLANIEMVSTPNLDLVSAKSNCNHAERKFINHADLAFQIHKIENAINNLEKNQQFIIIEYVINKSFTQKAMCERYGLSKSGFNKRKNQALAEFAKNYGLDCLSDDMKSNLVYS